MIRLRDEGIYTKDNVGRWAHCFKDTERANMAADSLTSYHYHEYVELLYIVSGHGVVATNGTHYEVEDGSMVIVNAQETHTTAFYTDTEYYCIKFLPSVIYDREQSLWDMKYVLPFVSGRYEYYTFSREETEGTGIEALLSEIVREWEGEQHAYELLIRANILRILAAVFRLWEKKGILREEREIPLAVKKAISYTVKNYATVTMEEVARQCGLSYNYFSYAFHEAMGMRFCQYLTMVRISAAERMLLSSDKSITVIAEETGFSSTSHFIASFRRTKGITPAAFRKQAGVAEK